MSREDPIIISALVGLCRQEKIACVIQVGAEDGYEASVIHVATGARAVAIEGDTRCRPAANVEYHHAVIGATDSDAAPFYLYDVGLSSTTTRTIKNRENAKPIMVPQYRLDTFCMERGITPDALIIDTEGTTLDVLEGCGALLDGVKVIYAEVQAYPIRPGIRTVGEVDALLLPMGFTHHRALPSYDGGAQSNLTWVRR